MWLPAGSHKSTVESTLQGEKRGSRTDRQISGPFPIFGISAVLGGTDVNNLYPNVD